MSVESSAGLRICAVRSISSGVASATLRAAVAVVKQTGWQVFRDEQPHASKVAADFVREKLPDPAFDRQGITELRLSPLATDLRFNGLGRFLARTALVEFFLEGRTRRSRVRHSGC